MQNGNVMPGTSKCFIVIMYFTQNPVARQARDKNISGPSKLLLLVG